VFSDKGVYSGIGYIYSEKQRPFSLLFLSRDWQKSRVSAVSPYHLAVFRWKNSDNSEAYGQAGW
jgi:hypothetical protein